METKNLPERVRYVVQERLGRWHATTLEFGLSAQAETQEEALRKLRALLHAFLDHARSAAPDEGSALLKRHARGRVYLRYALERLTGH